MSGWRPTTRMFWREKFQAFVASKRDPEAKLTRLEELCDALYASALAGDVQAAKLLFDRAFGSVESSKTALEMTEDDDGKRTLRVVYVNE